MTRNDVFTVLFDIEPCFNDVEKMAEDIAVGKFDVNNYTETLHKLDKAGRRLESGDHKVGRLIGLRLIDVVKAVRRYNGTTKSQNRLSKAFKKLDAAVNNETLYRQGGELVGL